MTGVENRLRLQHAFPFSSLIGHGDIPHELAIQKFFVKSQHKAAHIC
jgi:hypothetical protein